MSSPLTSANQWTGFYMITAFVMKELKICFDLSVSIYILSDTFKLHVLNKVISLSANVLILITQWTYISFSYKVKMFYRTVTIWTKLILYYQFSHSHCVKSAQIRSFFWSIFPCNRTRKNSVFGHFSRTSINQFGTNVPILYQLQTTGSQGFWSEMD